jgi:hypothetical protein
MLARLIGFVGSGWRSSSTGATMTHDDAPSRQPSKDTPSPSEDAERTQRQLRKAAEEQALDTRLQDGERQR